MDNAAADMDEPAGTKAAHHGWRDAGPEEGNEPVDVKAWREVEVKTAFGETMTVRYHIPLAVQAKGYAPAFESYLRSGKSGMGPNDRKTLSEGVDSAGGFLVPEDYHTELIKKVATASTFRPNARVAQTSRDAAKWPRVTYTTDDEYTSGVRFTWTGETPSSATVHRVTDPVFGIINIPVHTAMASMPVTNVLLEDAAFDVVGLSSDMLAEAFSLGENDAFWNGSGVSRPMGLLTQVDDASYYGPRSVVSGTTATLTADGLVDLAYALPSQYDAGAKMYMTKGTEKVIRKLKDTANNYLWPVWNMGGNFAAAPRDLLGYPVIRDEAIPEITTNGYPIVIGDLKGYIILDRVGFSIQRLNELYAETDITLLLARKRVGGQLAESYRVKVQKVAAS
jgi:HK97 family phage major capsid protein